jgi:hypothetical protein
MRRCSQVVVGLALFLASASSSAISVPLGTEDATLNLNLQLQPQFVVNEAGTPDGMNPSYDLFLRRARRSLGRPPLHAPHVMRPGRPAGRPCHGSRRSSAPERLRSDPPQRPACPGL